MKQAALQNNRTLQGLDLSDVNRLQSIQVGVLAKVAVCFVYPNTKHCSRRKRTYQPLSEASARDSILSLGEYYVFQLIQG